ncbi:hypothetical protein M407DRAFT_72614 [Tulasnella calospora MUT 4182]|uniref:PLD phosphodiesterase domain-containing protein n=1 Tax=Tulasnella calospora MUT 4182 TaxID=1051891 RepID=A0A0C3L233_9AGAM|nr:hypothetical protein M407DRAFT_72614 [Tulasnella calospora MUT 4182]
MHAARERSLSISSTSSTAGPSKIATAAATSQAAPTPSSGTVSSFLADRAKMERERLARQKRLRPQVQQPEETESEEDDEDSPPAKRVKAEDGGSRAVPTHTPTPKQPVASSSESLLWEGEIRQTANRHVLPSKDTKPVWRLSEILGQRHDQIKLIVFASYANDIDWILRVFPENVPVIFVGQPGENGNATVHNILPNWVKATPFLPNGRGCMHMKFMLVFYATGRLRIMISTANFVDYDWRDIENTAWVQDIPLRPKPIEHDPKADDFPAQFQHVLTKLNFAPALQSHLKGDHPQLPFRSITELRTRWDWSKVTVKLVVSMAGKYEGVREVAKSGHTNLNKAIRELGAICPEEKELALECQGSSIGTYSATWLNEFISSTKGLSLARWFSWKKQQPRGKIPAPSPSRLKILFPTLRTVDNSVLKRPGGGTMFCREKQWEAKTFPKQLFHDSKSKRGGVLMHSKMVLGIFVEKSKNTLPMSPNKAGKSSSSAPALGGWCYIGSHNFTPSAWGNLSGSTESPVMNVANYEMGILVPLPTENTENAAAELVCWERPAPAYRSGIDEPWVRADSLY